MSTLADAVAALAANPLPVVFLDTCVLLDVVRAPSRDGGVDTVLAARELLTHSQPPSHRVHLVVTDVVQAEWNSNLPATQRDGDAGGRNFITVNDLLDRLGLLSSFTPAVVPPGAGVPAQLTAYLSQLSADLLAAAMSIDRDGDCLSRALDRLLPKPPTLPARAKGTGTKDCIILEHALELSRRLGPGYAAVRYFVSSNTEDFAEKPSLRVNPALAADFAGAQLVYVASLSGVLAQLRTTGVI